MSEQIINENDTMQEAAQKLKKAFEDKLKDTVTKDEMQKLNDSFEKLQQDAQKAQENAEELANTKQKLDDLQKHLDELDMKGKGGVGRGEKATITKELEEKQDELAKIAKAESGAGNVTLKADMYTSNNTVNDVIAPDRLPGIYADPTRRQHVRDVMNTTTTNSDTIDFIQETAYTDGASPTKDQNEASQTDFTLTQKDAPVRTIDTYLTIHRNMLNDLQRLEGWVRTRVPNKLLVEEDNQLLYGNGSAPNINGITNQAQAYTDNLSDSNVNRFDVLFNAVTNAMVDEYMPNAILIHPNDFQKMSLTKDSNGMYVFPQAIAGQSFTINGARVIPSTYVTDDDFIVGDFGMGAELAIREDLTIEVSNSHDKNFTKGFITMYIHERLALPVHNPNAFVYGDFTTALAEGSG